MLESLEDVIIAVVHVNIFEFDIDADISASFLAGNSRRHSLSFFHLARLSVRLVR